MSIHQRAVRGACIAVAVSIAASVASASIFLLLRRPAHPVSGLSLERVASPSRAGAAMRPIPSSERELLGHAIRGERQRQGQELMDGRGSSASRTDADGQRR